MSEDQKNAAVSEPSQSGRNASKNLMNTLVDLGTAWAAHGLNAGKYSLENGARALEKTAKTLEGLAREFEKKSAQKNDKKSD